MGIENFKYDAVKKQLQLALNNNSLLLSDINENRYFILCFGFFNEHISTVSVTDKNDAQNLIKHYKQDENVIKIYVEKPSVDSKVYLRKESGWVGK